MAASNASAFTNQQAEATTLKEGLCSWLLGALPELSYFDEEPNASYRGVDLKHRCLAQMVAACLFVMNARDDFLDGQQPPLRDGGGATTTGKTMSPMRLDRVEHTHQQQLRCQLESLQQFELESKHLHHVLSERGMELKTEREKAKEDARKVAEDQQQLQESNALAMGIASSVIFRLNRSRSENSTIKAARSRRP